MGCRFQKKRAQHFFALIIERRRVPGKMLKFFDEVRLVCIAAGIYDSHNIGQLPHGSQLPEGMLEANDP